MIEGPSTLLDELRALQSQEDEIPAGWKTTSEWAEEWRLSKSQSTKLLREGVRKGILIRQMFTRKTGSMTRPVPHYRKS